MKKATMSLVALCMIAGAAFASSPKHDRPSGVDRIPGSTAIKQEAAKNECAHRAADGDTKSARKQHRKDRRKNRHQR